MKYHYEIHDNVISQELQTKVWDYIQKQLFYAARKNAVYPNPGFIVTYYPIENKKEYLEEETERIKAQQQRAR